MKKITASILMILLALTGFSACEPAHFKYQKTFIGAFDTVTVITGYAANEQEFEKTADAVYSELEEYGRLFDIYSEYDGMNNLKTVNDNAGEKAVDVDERIIDMLDFARSVYTLTDGKVNVMMGSVLSLWHKERENGLDDPENAKLPERTELSAAAEHTDIDRLVIDRENGTVFIDDPEASLDVGAVAKGWAVERICEKYDGTFVGTVSVGGNVRTLGTKTDGGKWNVGIINTEGDSVDSTVKADGGASVVTSGAYERFYTVDGRNYCHVIDPKTLFPAEKFRSVTVICRDSGLADALSTALFIMDNGEGLELIDKIDGADAYWICADGEKIYSEGFLNE